MPTKRCAHSVCNSDSRYSYRPYMEGIKFFQFVQPCEDLEMCKRWIQACRRENFSIKNITNYTYVCSKHFVGGAPSEEYPDPFPPNRLPPKRRKELEYAGAPEKRKKTTLLDNSTTNDVRVDSISIGEEIPYEESIAAEIPYEESIAAEEPKMKTVSTQTEEGTTKEAYTETRDIFFKKDIGCQTLSPTWLRSKLNAIETENKAIVAPWPGWSFNLLEKYPADFKYLTGVSVTDFLSVYKFLGEKNCDSLKYKTNNKTPKKNCSYSALTSKDKFVLYLIRIRRGFTVRELSIFFKISPPTISRILYVWTQFLFYELLPLRKLMFVPASVQKKTTPFCFKFFKNVRVILDCFEVEMQMSRNFRQQGNTYSNYKSRNTVKFLLGITVNGAISYISDGFEGSISDKEIVLQSDIMDLFDWGDSAMVDRGFDIDGEMLSIGVKVIKPPFLQGRDRFTAAEEILTRKIAKARIFVEHAVRRIKEYRIFSRGALPLSLLPQVSQMGYIISFFANFHEELVKA